MEHAGVFTRPEQGYDGVGLRTPAAELVMVPALGGRVISLRSRRTGREWCWHRDRADWLWANQPGDDFGRSPQAGIDECIPSVAGCTVRDRAIPDHGEVWFQEWQLDPAQLAAGRLSAMVRLPISPLCFERTIRAEGEDFIFDYAVTNLGPAREPYLWCLHPLFTIEAGDQLELPADVQSLRLNGGLGDRPMAHGDVWPYPEPFPGIRLDRLEVPGMPRGCVKAFTGRLTEGRAALHNPRTGDRLELTWDAASLPLLGVWLNRGHADFHHVALEPANGAPDSLADAISSWQQFSEVAPGATARWSLRWRVQ